MQDNSNDNIIPFERKKAAEGETFTHPPLLNIPFATKILVTLIVAAYLILWLGAEFITNFPVDRIYTELGFVSARWTGGLPFYFYTVFSLVAVNFLHGGWFHLAMNAATLVAFGSGVEKRLGAGKMLFIFFVSSVIALVTHLCVSPFSPDPVIGASGGISGLFGAILIVLKNDGVLSASNRILPFVILWIAISVLFGFMGSPDGSSIAWVAHIGGFIGGIGLANYLLKRKA